MDYSHIPYDSGVYLIRCTKSKKSYIGFSNNMHSRIQTHLRQLKKASHYVEQMNTDYKNYPDNWICTVVELTYDKHKESYWTVKYETHINGYNQTIGAQGHLGKSHTEESKQRIGNANRGRQYSDETKLQMSLTHVGMKGKSHSEETKQRIRESIKRKNELKRSVNQ